jgi:OOP family OmpA-OmpF porin
VVAACDRGGSTAPALLATRGAPVKVARDFDGDGVVDTDDRCPGAAGPLADGCPDPDSDGDGVLDSKDACKAEVGSQADGCPIPDGDGDGLLNPDDGCPGAKESRNGFADSDGCPDELPEDLVAVTGIVRGIAFAPDKDRIKRASYALLDRAAAVLAKYPDVRIEISAHTDAITSNEFYLRSGILGRRTAAVRRYLVEHGVDAGRIETRTAGVDEPVDTNKTAAGRARNRRFEFKVLTP